MRRALPEGSAARAAWTLSGVLLLAWAVVHPAAAQEAVPADTLMGRVISSDSTPISSARLSAVGDDGRVIRGQTGPDGRYLLTVPNGPGRYALTAQAFGYTSLSTVVARGPAGRRIVRDLRLNIRPVVLDTLRTRAPLPDKGVRRATPGETLEAFGALTAELFPREPGDLEGLAALAPGVVRLGAAEDGPALSIAGQPPEQSRTTVDGAPYGGAQLPSEGLRSMATLTSVYDVSRGQFSGGEIVARTIAGTNRWGGAFTLRLDDPTLRYGSLPGSALGARDRRLVASAGGGGALVRDRLFVYGAVDLSRTGGPRPYLDPGDPRALQVLGVAQDSARRFAGILSGLGVSQAAVPTEALREHATGLARVDYTLSDRHSLTARLDWRGSRASALGASPFRLPGGSYEHRTGDVGVLAQLASGGGAWSNELRVYHLRGDRSTRSDVFRPAGRVRVSSLEDGAPVASFLSFGAPPFLPAESEYSFWEAADEVARESADGVHLVKAGALFQEERLALSDAGNRYGTFIFDSLDDLAAGRPASFTRTLGGGEGEVARRHAALYLGHTWKPANELALTYGLRLEGSRYRGRPALSPSLGSLLGSGDPGIPDELFLSPRIGFSYRVGGSARATVRGGIGHYGGTVPLRSIGPAWNETGTADGGTRLTCIGPAAPVPDWRAYAADPGAIPASCAGEELARSDFAPPVTVFGPGFGAPRTWRMSLGLEGSITGRISFQTGAMLVRGLRVPTAVDRNLDLRAPFTLPHEAGRPVYVGAEEIDPGSGLVVPGASRLQPDWGVVREVDGRGSSWTGQLTGGVVGILGKNTLLGLTYTYGRSWNRAGSVPVPGGAAASAGADPLRLEWGPSDFDRRHSFQLILTDRLTQDLRVSAVGQLGSGLPFTPLVAGDVNGDGTYNDRAFVFAPGPGADVAGGMARLLEDAPGGVRECLRRQVGTIAGRNSCRSAWWSSLDLLAEYTPPVLTSSRRLVFTLTASNVTAGLDYLLHGSGGLRGWGQFPIPDPNLLEVRGFDPVDRAYRYAVNPRVGQPVGGGSLRIPFRLVLQARVTAGADPRYQPRAQLVAAVVGARGPAQIRGRLAERIRNVPATILALDARDPGELGLTPEQLQRLRTAAAALEPRAQAALEGLTEAFAQRGAVTAARRAKIDGHARAAHAVLEEGVRAARETLRPDQWALLPAWLVQPAGVEDLQQPPRIELSSGSL